MLQDAAGHREEHGRRQRVLQETGVEALGFAAERLFGIGGPGHGHECRAGGDGEVRQQAALVAQDRVLDLLNAVDVCLDDEVAQPTAALFTGAGAGKVGQIVVFERVRPVLQEEALGFLIQTQLDDDGSGAIGIDDGPDVGFDSAGRRHQGDQGGEQDESAHGDPLSVCGRLYRCRSTTPTRLLRSPHGRCRPETP